MRMGNKKIADNRGSTLILVIIFASFIMLLAVVVLSLTVTNRQMKSIDYKAKENFYQAEIALDEIRAGLEEYVAEALEGAYKKVLEQFLSSTEEERRDILKDTFLDNLEISLSLLPGYYNIGLLEDALRDITGFSLSSDDNRLIRNEDSLTLKNIRIAYEDADGYLTTVSTDILIHTPLYSFAAAYTSPAYAGYTLIADRQLKLDSTGLANGAKVYGSIYAGDSGISITNSKLDISQADHIVTRGDIDVRHNSTLTINDRPSIWVKNIWVNSDTTEEFEINIDGKCYVADDLTIDGNNSKVKIQGEYYGYSYGSYGEGEADPPLTAGASSAILINGKRSGLEFSNMDALLLGGRAFLSPDYDGDSKGVYTGESISVKDMQVAYLVPEDFIWSGSNPVTHEEYLAKPAGVDEVDYSRSSLFPINLEDYVDGFLNLHYIIHGEQYKYYYLKFKSEAKANEYMQKYYEVFRTGSDQVINIDNHVAKNADGIVLDNSITNIFLTAGNLMTYTAGGTDLISNTVDDGPSLNAMRQLAIQLSGRYDSMKKNLQPISANPAYDEHSVFNSIIDMDKLDLAPYKSTYFVDLDGVPSYVHIINNPAAIFYTSELADMERQGIIIARGSICVDKDYKGLILVAEDLKLMPSVNVYASRDIVDGILGKGISDINRYFRDFSDISIPSPGEANAGISIEDMIEFINWKKND